MDMIDDQLRPVQHQEAKLSEHEARMVYTQLETVCWAPWLQYQEDELVGQAVLFPDGQLVEKDEAGNLMGSLSTNRINWGGSLDELPTWDQIAGAREDFSDTYVADGNTISLMSMNVDSAKRGEHLPQKLIQRVQKLAQKEDIKHIIGDFRPNGFGAYKRETGNVDFAAYCQQTRDDGMLVDGWLRAVSRMGGEFLRPDNKSMMVEVPMDQFNEYRESYTPEKWWRITEPKTIELLEQQHEPLEQIDQIDEVWECEETGTWYVDTQNQKAVYIESNIWGELPISSEGRPEKHPARYNLSAEELEQGQADLVSEVEAKFGKAEGVYTVWLKPWGKYTNIIRTFEAQQFPEVPKLVTDEVENDSQFLAIIDTRGGAGKVIHGTRISGARNQRSDEHPVSPEAPEELTGIIMVDEIIMSQQGLTAQEFYDYYRSKHYDMPRCVGVETNFRVGGYTEQVEDYNGLSIAQVGYLAIFKLLEDQGLEPGNGGVFANINIGSIRSFSMIGLQYEALAGREDLRTPTVDSNGNPTFDPKYRPVLVPSTANNIEIFKQLYELGAQQLYL